MPHEFFKYTQQLSSLCFLTVLFGLSTNQSEFLKSVVQKICTFLCLKIGPKVGKVLQRQRRKCDNSDGTVKIPKMAVFGSYPKTTRAINMKFGYMLENRMLNPPTKLKECILSSFRTNLYKLHNYELFLSSKL